MKKIVFMTGTRADFGKLKSLIQVVADHQDFEYSIFATGMHMLYRYGMTVEEIHKAGFSQIFTFMNQVYGEPMEMVLANTVSGLSRYIHEYNPDMIVVHGDRVEAMAGAIVGSLRNILVGHIEGGEISGTIDELIRHSTSKLAHLHFVANTEAQQRLMQLGERAESIHVIGSPDIDVMLSGQLPSIETVKKYYEIPFDDYGIVMFHPVTTELDQLAEQVRTFVDAILATHNNYIVIYPNNDTGSKLIFNEYKRFEGLANIKMYPSIRFEYFLSLLKYAQAIIGNSSAGIHEAPVFGVPTVNVGSRQQDRFSHYSITDVDFAKGHLLEAILKAIEKKRFAPCDHFGAGKSAKKFMDALNQKHLWQTPRQKMFMSFT